MIQFESRIEGKKTEFGYIRDIFEPFSCNFCSNFEYHEGMFDSILYREDGETIYLRMPFRVIEGELDHYSAYIQFGKPYVIKHVVNLGLDYDENSLLTATGGFSQFQDPLDRDGEINDKSRWVKAGKEKINQMLNSFEDELVS
ncbi:YugN family protein [Rummeliibacillus sp. NPDC094406]|uniref:YugN family protein n=1 Tax=Rummeliibacillus sp. NPDC094406 TaxID=3364511 RepID=UPI0038075D38